MVRPGAVLYGYHPGYDPTELREESERKLPLKPVMSLRSRIISLRDVPAEQGVGYDSTFITSRPSKIAVCVVGPPLDLQPKLLRVLEEQEFERVGSAHTIRSDVRVIAATNRPLEELVEAGEFRADLYYRLNVFPIDLPALRERPEDIPLLVRYFVAHHARSLGRRIESIPPDVMERLVRHPWPGNIRELQHAVHRAVILSRGASLQLPPLDAGGRIARTPTPQAETFDDAVREHILEVLRDTNGVVAGPRGAAARLGLKRTTLMSKMEKLGIEPGDVTTARAQRSVAQSAPSIAF